MQKQEPEMSLACMVLWFALLWVGYRYFPAGWLAPWNTTARFSFLLSCGFWVVCILGSLMMICSYFGHGASPVFRLEPAVYIGITFSGLICIAFAAFLQWLNGGNLPSAFTTPGQLLATTVTEPPTDHAELLDNEQSLRRGMEKLSIEQDKQCSFITEIEHERALVVSKLRQAGVSSNSDLEGNAEGHVYAQELLEIECTLRTMQDRARAQSLVLTKAESLLRKIGRQNRLREVGLDSNAPQQFAQLRVEIDEMLRPDSTPSSNVLQLDQVLREALLDR